MEAVEACEFTTFRKYRYRIIYEKNDGLSYTASKSIVSIIGRKGVEVLVSILLNVEGKLVRRVDDESKLLEEYIIYVDGVEVKHEYRVLKGIINVTWFWYFRSLNEFKCAAKMLLSRELSRVNNELGKLGAKLEGYERKYGLESRDFVRLMMDWYDGKVNRLPQLLEIESKKPNNELTKWWNLYDEYRKLVKTKKIIIKALNNLG